MNMSSLHHWCYIWIDNHCGNDWNLEAVFFQVVFKDVYSEKRKVLSSIAFTSKMDWLFGIFRVFFQKFYHELKKMLRSLFHVIDLLKTIWKPSSNRLININDIIWISPGVFCRMNSESIIVFRVLPNAKGTILDEEAKHARCSGTSIDPYNKWCILIFMLE